MAHAIILFIFKSKNNNKMEKVLVVKQVIRPVENASRQVVIMSKAKADRLEQHGLLGARISDGINSCYSISR